MKILTLFLVTVFCLGLAGCSKDAEFNAFTTEFETVTNEMSAKLETGDVDGAQKIFDAKKDSLKTKWAGIKDARGVQVSKETQTKFEESMKKNGATLQSAIMKGSMKNPNPASAQKMQALMKEYLAIIQT